MPLRIAIADDHPLVLDAMEQLFRVNDGVSVVARCRNGEEALDAVRRLTPDVLVLDLMMPVRDGLGVVHAMQQERSPTRVVLLTAGTDDDQLRQGVRLGAHGVVLKETASHVLVDAVRQVGRGGHWLEEGLGGRSLRARMDRAGGRRERTGDLTAREEEIVRMVVAGLRNRAIADRLFISEGTVKVHLHNIYEKLAVRGRYELMVAARHRGLA
jgi:DNA-binding NarL/FixJ family response regulator